MNELRKFDLRIEFVDVEYQLNRAFAVAQKFGLSICMQIV